MHPESLNVHPKTDTQVSTAILKRLLSKLPSGRRLRAPASSGSDPLQRGGPRASHRLRWLQQRWRDHRRRLRRGGWHLQLQAFRDQRGAHHRSTTPRVKVRGAGQFQAGRAPHESPEAVRQAVHDSFLTGPVREGVRGRQGLRLQILQLSPVRGALRGGKGQLRAERPRLQGHGHGEPGLLRHRLRLRLLREEQRQTGG